MTDLPATDRPVALVTGAARGIGAATARRLAADGFSVVLVDICADISPLPYPMATKADLDASVAACGQHAVGVVADVRRQDELDAAVRTAVDEFGGLDVAVAAAGIMGGGDPAWNISEEAFLVNIDINLTGVWRTAKATIPAMLERPKPRRGRFVAIASAAGMRGNPTIADYTAAKHGVVGLVRSLALELGRRGITANAIAPGSTETAILEASGRLYGLESIDEFAVHHTIGRNLRPDEIAAGISWLCMPESSGVTGIVLPIDGGMTV
ncbi:MAG TPA: mycofactocin-coupled SDR family oxidoreductase [Microthrixaceae bacterium]|jgi:SDR family mycofactocin-dependent oxidoreductase|nr:mycofactocin-coupled SDR family oxidoreductase [Microthrixaceae bacterium]